MKEPNTEKAPEEAKKKKNLRYLVLLIVNTVLFFAVYRILLSYAELTDDTFWSFVVMVIYLALTLGLTLGYLIYNRFLYRKGITSEQLPAEWSEEQKQAFLEDGNRRLARSKWMITLIFPLIFTFLMDAIDLFILDTFFR